MLEKELAEATKIAEQASKKVEKLRKQLLTESEKTHVRIKRELIASRKRHKVASARLSKAKNALRKRATPDNHKKVEALMKQAQEFAESLPKIAKAAYEAAEKYLAVKTDAVMEDRKAKAANQAAIMVEKAAAKSSRKPASKKKAVTSKKKAAPKKRATAKKKAPAKRKATR